jgi:flagellar basal-body rod modification protein FlgD
MSNNIDASILSKLGISNAGTAQAAESAKDKLGQKDFLKLMVAQLKNQDPMKPMDNGNFLGQMAQFSSVTGLQELQASFNQLAGVMQSNQALQASALVGRSALVPGNAAVLSSGQAVSGAVDLPASTSDVSLAITDQSGKVVRLMNMGPQASGLASFQWDGKTDAGELAPAGRYKIVANAMLEGKVQAVDTLVAARVESVTLGRGGQESTLNLAGLGSLEMSKVRQIM